ncbi:heterodimeric geranylgeranyl pyrophosphate synthase large subunit 1, chloroplastic isoform X1 [Selaginella moellendorffii]|nr:heterodimeric geranylgeranyl pyrophosphate synthase large subunit 1, chloroplastic isoform X1 [Selaginella moellendorffii]|eukprot:XP_002968087.2 heterodimeric geranylgeranyl pyrophosphate synthase large subunit 1, chloroplastic isoform X1 [Selaginella moellendorffii]
MNQQINGLVLPPRIHYRRVAASAAPGTTTTTKSSKFDYDLYVKTKREAVSISLHRAFPPPLKQPETLKMHDAMRYAVGGGRRTCPIACIAACELVGGTQDDAMPGACALEMIKASFCVQDDLPSIDDSELRHGKPTVHRAFGIPTALFAGTALLALGFEHLAARYSGDTAARMVAEVGRAIGSTGLLAGQAVDLGIENPDRGVELETLEFVHLHKTSALLEASLVAGAIAGGASEQEIEALRAYGRVTGLLYQIVDDVADATKTMEELGKIPGQDAMAGKSTYSTILGVDKSREMVGQLLVEAKERLGVFEETKALPLIHLADHFANWA